MSATPAPALDWTAALTGPFANELRAALRSLPLHSLHRYPPPRGGSLPFGHEVRIARRFLAGESSSLDSSGLWSAYLALATPRERLAHRGLVRCDPLSVADWESLIGREARASWCERGLLADQGAGLRAPFRVVALREQLFLADADGDRFPGYVHIGQDSLGLVEHLATLPAAQRESFLDVGTGSGVVLLTARKRGRRAVGVDINPRAVRAARFNAALNGAVCEVREADVFTAPPAERFGLITWNIPFVFMPEHARAANLDGFGGRLGIELTLRFVDALPRLLSEDGLAVVLSSSPILDDGRDVLAQELSQRCAGLGLAARIHVLQAFWMPSLWRFHREHAIRRFESVILELRPGSGRVEHSAPTVTRRAVDALRERVYYARYGR